MKYSIRGDMEMANKDAIVPLLNQYQLWRLIVKKYSFEVWLDTKEDKNALFNELKQYVINPEEVIDWHECTHDEEFSKPCVIVEEYRG